MYHDDLIYLTRFLTDASARYMQQEPDWAEDKKKSDQVLLYAKAGLFVVELLFKECGD